MFERLRNIRGLSVIELLAASGLVAMIVGLSVTPIMQMKKLEKKADYQSSLNIAHQVAVQKARNTKYIKDKLGITNKGNAIDQCLGGRGTACNFPDVVDSFAFKQSGGFEAAAGAYEIESRITFHVTCPPPNIKCTEVEITVDTKRIAGKNDLDWKGKNNNLIAVFNLPALSLAGRQEIDFTGCLGANKILTGINYETLVATCAPITGNVSCQGIAAAGPLTTIGNTNTSDPANCQPPPTVTCANGMNVFGLVGDQAECINNVTCVDPLSSNCQNPPACVPNYQPLPTAVCAGAAFTQVDANNCPGSTPVSAVGTNAGLCSANTCTLSGPVRWPNPVSGPCGVGSAVGSAAPGASATLTNENLGYYGTFTTTCVDKSPAPSSFNLASAANTCTPVVCSGVPATVEWSAAGMKSATPGPGMDTAGPWACSGPLNALPNGGTGTITSVQADPAAKGIATATPIGGPNDGYLNVTCNDPGPATGARSGVLSISSSTCKPSGGYCLYQCIDNFVQTVDGRLEVGETSIEFCKVATAMLTKFSMGCNGYGGATCTLTNPTGPISYAKCEGNTPPAPTPTPPPVCPPGQVMGYSWFAEFLLAPDTTTFGSIGTTNGFSPSEAAAQNDQLSICAAYIAKMPNKNNCSPFDPPLGPKCGVLSSGSLPNEPPSSVKNVCTFMSDTAAIGSGEMTVGQAWTFASQASKGGFSCDADPAANVKCVYWNPYGQAEDYYYDSCSSITLGNVPPTGTGTCELQTVRCVPK